MVMFNRKITNFNFWDDLRWLDFRKKSVAEKWNGPDNAQTYQKIVKDKSFTTYSDQDFYYKTNSLGFRSEEFDTPSTAKILYAGCSITEGIGLPVEHTWANFLNVLISSEINKPVPLFNVGLGGSSIETICRTVYMVIKQKKITPDLVMILLPSVSRNEIIYLDARNNPSIYNFIATFDKYDDPRIKMLHNSLLKSFMPAQRVHEVFRSMLFLYEFLSARNIPMYFQTWDNTIIEFSSSVQLSFLDILKQGAPSDLKQCLIPVQMSFDYETVPAPHGLPFKQNIARDGMHPGPNTHWNFANETFSWLKKQDGFLELISKWKAAK